MTRPTKRWERMAEAYKYFARSFTSLDFSDDAAEEMFLFESTGEPLVQYHVRRENGLFNGYAVGKHWMDVTITMWKEGLAEGSSLKFELLEDEDIPDTMKDIIRELPGGPCDLYRYLWEQNKKAT